MRELRPSTNIYTWNKYKCSIPITLSHWFHSWFDRYSFNCVILFFSNDLMALDWSISLISLFQSQLLIFTLQWRMETHIHLHFVLPTFWNLIKIYAKFGWKLDCVWYLPWRHSVAVRYTHKQTDKSVCVKNEKDSEISLPPAAPTAHY